MLVNLRIHGESCAHGRLDPRPDFGLSLQLPHHTEQELTFRITFYIAGMHSRPSLHLRPEPMVIKCPL